MVQIDQLAEAALMRDSLRLRSLLQDWLAGKPRMSDVARPETPDPRILVLSAALVELFAARLGQQPPAWTRDIGPLAQPFYLLESASHMKRLRTLCEQEAPEPLRRRRIFAPPNFLEFA